MAQRAQCPHAPHTTPRRHRLACASHSSFSHSDAVPSAANLTYYLEISQEKVLLRRMIATCTDVVGRVYDYQGDVETLLDEVEKEILRINESRAQSGTASVKELVGKAILTVENYLVY